MNYSKPHIHELIVQYFQNKELDDLYISFFLKSLAESLISIFIPIYLLTLGYGISDVAIYCLIYFSMVSLTMPLCMKLHSKIGIKKTMALGTLVLVIYYLLLNFVGNGLSYQLIAVFFGVSISLYYSAYHIEFTRSAQKKSEGKALSMIRSIMIIASIIGPIIGSLFIEKLSFSFLFVLVSIILVASVVPLFFTKDFSVGIEKFSMRRIVKSDTKKKAVSYQASAFLQLASGVFWPIFIYLAIEDIVSLGIIVSLTSFLLVFMLVYLGKQADKNAKRTLRWGTFLHAPFWIIRMFLLTPIGLFFSNLFASITHSIIDISFNRMIYNKAKKSKNIIDYFLFREFNLEIGRLFILVPLIFISDLTWLFITSFFVTFTYLILVKEVHLESIESK